MIEHGITRERLDDGRSSGNYAVTFTPCILGRYGDRYMGCGCAGGLVRPSFCWISRPIEAMEGGTLVSDLGSAVARGCLDLLRLGKGSLVHVVFNPDTWSPYLSGSTGAIGEISIARLEVKFLDPRKTNICESLSQAGFH